MPRHLYPQGKGPQYLFDRRLCGSQNQSEPSEENKICSSAGNTNIYNQFLTKRTNKNYELSSESYKNLINMNPFITHITILYSTYHVQIKIGFLDNRNDEIHVTFPHSTPQPKNSALVK
jgi:hypothetical protein